MPAFDFVILGCGGGPSENNLSSYLLKAAESSWNEGIIAVEAGSGIGALTNIMENQPDLFGRPTDNSDEKPYSAADVLSWIRCYLITHAHMDHINGLVLCTGSLAGAARRIYAAHQTLKDIERVFSDRLWPNLASWNDDEKAMLIYSQLHPDGKYTRLSDTFSVRSLPLSHGHTQQGECYESTAFFIKHDTSAQELLFFGDVEPDGVSANPRNREVWRTAASKIPQTLSTIFVECSYPTGRPDDQLYGHMSPEHLARELTVLAEEVLELRRARQGNGQPVRKRRRTNTDTAPKERRNVLSGLVVYIIHCKDDLQRKWDKPIHQVIAGQVRALTEAEELGVEIRAAEQGMLISV